MDNSVYIMLSRQTALFREMAVRANNVANSATTGFMAEDVLYNPYSVQDGRGKKMDFANDVATFRRTEPGSFKVTGAPLDIAIKGQGYLVVDTPAGQRYTRAGSLQMNGEGQLTTAQGYPVLDIGNQPIVFNPEDKQITIGEAGNISVDGQERARLNVVKFANDLALERVSGTLFKSAQPPESAPEALVQQGMLEGSNVNAVTEITRVIDVSRSTASTGKFIEAMYDLQRRTGRVLTGTS